MKVVPKESEIKKEDLCIVEKFYDEKILLNGLLYYAVQTEQPLLVEALLNKGANPNVQDKKGRTPLHYAAQKGSYGIFVILLEFKADPNIKDNKGQKPKVVQIFNEQCRCFLSDVSNEDSECCICRGMFGRNGELEETSPHKRHKKCYEMFVK